MKDALVNYFRGMAGLRMLRRGKAHESLDLCYERERRQGSNGLPNMTFHLKPEVAGGMQILK